VLGGGDDHALAATFPEDLALPDGWRHIGHVVHGSGLTVDGKPHRGPAGWEHFR
jgi:thiamine-monophosphate kinase